MNYKAVFFSIVVFVATFAHAEIPDHFWQASYRGSLCAQDVNNLTPYEQALLHKRLSMRVDFWQFNVFSCAQGSNSKFISYVGSGVRVASFVMLVCATIKIGINRAQGIRVYEDYMFTKSASDLALLEVYDTAIWKWLAIAGFSLVTGALSRIFAEGLNNKCEEHEVAEKTLVNLRKALELVEESVHAVA